MGASNERRAGMEFSAIKKGLSISGLTYLSRSPGSTRTSRASRRLHARTGRGFTATNSFSCFRTNYGAPTGKDTYISLPSRFPADPDPLPTSACALSPKPRRKPSSQSWQTTWVPPSKTSSPRPIPTPPQTKPAWSSDSATKTESTTPPNTSRTSPPVSRVRACSPSGLA